MMSFTPEEMDSLSCHGNDLCRRVWLGLYDARSHTEPDSKDEMKVRDFMSAKYEKKRWYVAPTDSMLDEARKQNTIPEKKPEQTRPLRTLGGHIPNLIVQSSQPPRTVAAPPPPVQASAVQASAVQHSKPAPPTSQMPQRSATMDLLGDLGGDPFAGPTPASVPTSASAGAGGGGFADFANFDGGMNQPAMAPQSMGPGLTPVASSAPPSDGSFGAFSSSPMSTTTTSSAHVVPPFGGDKYAALADLDSVFGAPSSSLPVNWDSSFGGGGRESWAGGGVPSNGVTASTPATVSNPFGVTSSAAFSQPQAGHQVANPFMAPQAAPGGGAGYPQGVPQPPSYGQYGQSMPVGYPVSAAGMPASCANTGFPAPQYAASTAGQFQNGGVAAPAPSAGAWGAFGSGFTPAGMMPAAQGQYQKPGVPGMSGPQPGVGAPMPGQQQFGVTPALSGWGGQPVAGNPFMSAAAGQQPVPPRGSSTNPFL